MHVNRRTMLPDADPAYRPAMMRPVLSLRFFLLFLALSAATAADMDPVSSPLPTVKPTVKNGTPAAKSTGATKPDANAKSAGATKSAPAEQGNQTDPTMQDLVILDNQQRITGSVVEGAEPGLVVINTGSGTMRFREDRVKEVYLGLGSRLAKLRGDDLNELVLQARWCHANHHDAEALQLLAKAVALPGVDLDSRGLYAQLVDQSGNPAAAVPLYRAYRKAGGSDAAILARLDQLEEAARRYVADNPGATPPIDDTPLPAGTLPKVPLKPAPMAQVGLEAKGWESEKLQYSNPVEMKLAPVDDSGGPNVLHLTFTGPSDATKRTDKAAIRKSVQYAIGEQSVLSFSIANHGEQPFKLAIALKTGDFEYFESAVQTVPLNKGFTELRFDLRSPTFKSKATNWQNSATVTNLDDVKELQVLVYNGTASGELLIKGMTFVKTNEL